MEAVTKPAGHKVTVRADAERAATRLRYSLAEAVFGDFVVGAGPNTNLPETRLCGRFKVNFRIAGFTATWRRHRPI